MARELRELRVSEDISAASVAFQVYTPDNNAAIKVLSMSGDAVFTKSSVVKIVWCYNHATEPGVVIWSIKGSQSNVNLDYNIANCDGIRKLAIVCDNGEDGSVVMSGRCNFKVRT